MIEHKGKNSLFLITDNFVIISGYFFFVIYHKHVMSVIDNGTFRHCQSEEMTFQTVLFMSDGDWSAEETGIYSMVLYCIFFFFSTSKKLHCTRITSHCDTNKSSSLVLNPCVPDPEATEYGINPYGSEKTLHTVHKKTGMYTVKN